MTIRLAMLVGFVAVGTLAHASSPVTSLEVMESGTTHRDLYAMTMHRNGTDGMAVGDRGVLVVTRDGGTSWEQRQLDTQLALFDVAMNEDRRLVVGQMGLVRYSDDGGESWSEADSGTDNRLLGVSANDAGLAVAVGAFGTIRRSRDGGQSWQTPDFDVSQVVEDAYQAHLNDVYVAEDGTVLIVGEFGLILRSPDGGETWNPVHSGDVSLFGLHMRDDGVGYAVGQQGTILRTADRGESWSALPSGIDANFLGVCSSTEGAVVIPGMRRMVASGNGGASWVQVHAGDVDRNWYVAASCDADGAYAVGHTTRVIRLAMETEPAPEPPPTSAPSPGSSGTGAPAGATAESESSAPAQDEPSQRLVATDVVNVRAGQGTDTEIIGQLESGTAVEVVTDPDGDWIEIGFGAGTGWVYRPLFETPEE